jgi:hypothetical protein
MHLLAGNIIMGRLARAGTGVFDLLLNDDHDVLTFDGIARSLLRASIVTAQIDKPLGLSPTPCSCREHWLSDRDAVLRQDHLKVIAS